MEGTLGEIILFAGNYAPKNWHFCDGQLMRVPKNPALFSILGCQYGGDGEFSYALPKIDPPAPNLHYIICINGNYPQKN
jgi:microcystin-dependent protein